MSVILTAGRKAVKSKSAKQNKPKRKKPRAQFNPTPPLSTPETTVWHWDLDGIPTTIMYRKQDEEIWCNGSVLDQKCVFAKDDGEGASSYFQLEVKAGILHHAEIKRKRSKTKKILCHQLIVDGFMILEHTSKPTVAETFPKPTDGAYGAMADPPAYYESPPSYDEIANDKKTK